VNFFEYIVEKEALSPLRLTLKETKDDLQISENLKYHLEHQLSLSTSVFRFGSEAYLDLVNEVRCLYENRGIQVNENDEFILMTEAGRKGIYQGKEVPLDSPRRGGTKKYYVFVNSGRKNADGRVVAKKIAWGDPKLSVKNMSDERRKSFLARHKCSEKKDRMTPGWWACNVHRYAKQLGLTSSKRW